MEVALKELPGAGSLAWRLPLESCWVHRGAVAESGPGKPPSVGVREEPDPWEIVKSHVRPDVSFSLLMNPLFGGRQGPTNVITSPELVRGPPLLPPPNPSPPPGTTIRARACRWLPRGVQEIPWLEMEAYLGEWVPRSVPPAPHE